MWTRIHPPTTPPEQLVEFNWMVGLLVVVGCLWPGNADAGFGEETAAREHRFTVVSAEKSRIMNSGTVANLALTIRNDGGRTWTREARFRVSYRWRKVGEKKWRHGVRTELPADLSPGAAAEIRARVLAPAQPGIYEFRWDMVEEKVGWFSRSDPTPSPVHRVVVLPFYSIALSGAVTIIALFSVLAFLRRDSSRGAPTWIPPELDLIVLVAAVTVKQHWALVTVGWPFAEGGVWISVAIASALALVLLPCSQRVRPWLAWIVNAVISVVLCGDAVYIRFFQDLPSFALIGAGGQMAQVAGSIASLLESTDAFFFADLLPGLLLALVVSRQAMPPRRRLAVVVVLVLTALPGVRGWVGLLQIDHGVDARPRFHIRTAQQVGVLGFHVADAGRTVVNWIRDASISDDDWQLVKDVVGKRSAQRVGSSDQFGVARGFNLLMIQVESLQSQLLGLEINGQAVTPNLNRLASESVYFTYGIDQTMLGRTSDAELLSQASLLPDMDGPAVFRHAGNDLVGLADVLGEHGYSTMVAVPFRESFWNRRYSHPALGFTTRFYDQDFAPGPVVGWGLNDRDFLVQAAQKLEALPEPFFGYLITLSNHHPFPDFPDEFKSLDVEGIESGTVAGYMHSMKWADEAIGALIDRLRASGLASRTVIVVFGDHGAGLQRDSDGSGVLEFGNNVAQRVLGERVPVVIHVPSADFGPGEVDLPMGLMDLPPTLTALLGIDPQTLPWLGRNLFGTPAAGPVPIGGRAWVDGHHIFSERTERCFDRFTATQVSPARCEAGRSIADRLRRANTLIWNGDLQPDLREFLELSSVPSGP